MAELLGTHSYQLDPKGRVSLPTRFREAFADGAWLTLGPGPLPLRLPQGRMGAALRGGRVLPPFRRRRPRVRAAVLRLLRRGEARRAGARRRSRSGCGRRSGSTRTSSCSACATGWRSGIARRTSGYNAGIRRRVPGRYARSQEVRRRWHDPGPRRAEQAKLAAEVRQSLSLIGMTALTLLASIGFGVLAGQLGDVGERERRTSPSWSPRWCGSSSGVPRRGTVVDMTLGAGGHAEALLAAGVDRVDRHRPRPGRARAGGRAPRAVRRSRSARVPGVVRPRSTRPSPGARSTASSSTSGVSSMQLDRAERGSATATTGRSTCAWAGTPTMSRRRPTS